MDQVPAMRGDHLGFMASMERVEDPLQTEIRADESFEAALQRSLHQVQVNQAATEDSKALDRAARDLDAAYLIIMYRARQITERYRNVLTQLERSSANSA